MVYSKIHSTLLRNSRCGPNLAPAIRATKPFGFTLIEVIVVTAIIGLMATFLVGALIQDSDRIAKLEAQRFVAVAQEVSDEAVFTGTPHKIAFAADGYSVEPLIASGASASTLNELHRQRKVAEEVRFRVFFFDIDANDDEFDASIQIDTLGTFSPFEVRFIGDESEFVVSLDDKGQLQLLTEGVIGS